ncbi:hypothetical protein ACFLWK_00905 [Chloroflexota bacterium]
MGIFSIAIISVSDKEGLGGLHHGVIRAVSGALFKSDTARLLRADML